MPENEFRPPSQEKAETFREVKETIESHLPGFAVKDIPLQGAGENNWVFLVNSEYVFRFPLSKDALSEIGKEAHLLEALHPVLELPVPQYEFVVSGGVGESFVGYKMIEGVSFAGKRYESLRNRLKSSISW